MNYFARILVAAVSGFVFYQSGSSIPFWLSVAALVAMLLGTYGQRRGEKGARVNAITTYVGLFATLAALALLEVQGGLLVGLLLFAVVAITLLVLLMRPRERTAAE